jgi:hypothetical protein
MRTRKMELAGLEVMPEGFEVAGDRRDSGFVDGGPASPVTPTSTDHHAAGALGT